mgnify:CR=1 FL=1
MTTSKQDMLDLLLGIAQDLDTEVVRAADRISAIKQICLMQGYNAAEKKEITTTTMTLKLPT